MKTEIVAMVLAGCIMFIAITAVCIAIALLTDGILGG